ncbi:hypothetical protein BWI17_15320 [Betaproteobacteria bacterium GR16-43]|nr:hypothetical protein BWI17_15320 [Betaproteobacteria bacterium GR16-43]
MNQEISSLMDGELDPHASDRAIQSCTGCPEGKQAWDEYHLIGEVMRDGGARRFDIASAVMAKLEQEPTVLAPRASRRFPVRAQAFGRIAFAAAASVATIGAVGWIATQGMSTGSAPATMASTGGVTLQANVPVEQVVLKADPAYAAIEVNDYLAAHRQVPTPDQYRTVAARQAVRTR